MDCDSLQIHNTPLGPTNLIEWITQIFIIEAERLADCFEKVFFGFYGVTIGQVLLP